MAEARKNYQKWQVLCQNIEPRTEKSISSKASGRVDRYTPKKTPLKSENKINLAVLKNRQMTPLQISSRVIKMLQKQEPRKQQKSVVVQPVSMKFLGLRNHSIDHEYMEKPQRYKNEQNERSDTDFVVDIQGFSKEDNILDEQSNIKQPEEKISKGFNLPRMDTFGENQLSSLINSSQAKHTLIQNTEVYNQQKAEVKKSIEINRQKNNVQFDHKSQLSLEKIFQRCVAGLNVLEEQILGERIQIQRMLQEKHQTFIEFKQKLLKIFAKKQNLIINPQNRKLLQPYLPQQIPQQIQRNTLTRVTSERLFNRNQRDLCEENVILTQRNQRQQSAHGRSVQSRADSVYKKNFDRIFTTINKLKSELSDDPIELKNRMEQIGNSKKTSNETQNNKNLNKINTIYTNPNLDIHQRINLIKNINHGSQAKKQDLQELRNNVNHNQLQSQRKQTDNIYVDQWRSKLSRFKI